MAGTNPSPDLLRHPPEPIEKAIQRLSVAEYRRLRSVISAAAVHTPCDGTETCTHCQARTYLLSWPEGMR